MNFRIKNIDYNYNKYFRKDFIVIFFFMTVLASCQIFKFTKGVRQDAEEKRIVHKKFMVKFSMNGLIDEKSTLDLRKDRYYIKIKLLRSDSVENIAYMGFPPYYDFKGEYLNIEVTKEMYDASNEGDIINKRNDKYELLINNKPYSWLNKNGSLWLAIMEND